MPTTFNWLHLSDLHFGMSGQDWLWPTLKHEFFKDLRVLGQRIGSWDVVFFTGDFSQRGERAEFDLLSGQFEELWKVFAADGFAPVLCAIPGNHDVQREAVTPTAAAALRHWWEDPQTRREFWDNPNSDLREIVSRTFANYSSWLGGIQVPRPRISAGILPGDFAAVVGRSGATIGVVGLNSTFLQISPGDFRGRLDIHSSQINAVCDGDPVVWTNANAAAVLLTHQPPSWLSDTALQHFRSEIYPAARFYSQLCGHLHDPSSYDVSEGGSSPRRLRQAPSLFGLEKWDGATPGVRIHGYNAGQFLFSGTTGQERVWPRLATPAKHGGLRLKPDHGYDLSEDECYVSRFDLQLAANQAAKSGPRPAVSSASPTPEIHSSAAGVLELLQATPDVRKARENLRTAPRLKLAAAPQHKVIRQEEQSLFEHGLHKSRCVWLVADWGVGQDGFFGVLSERFSGQGEQEIFHLNCDEATDSDSFLALFPQQFGMPLQSLCPQLQSIGPAFLMLDGLHPNLCHGDQLTNLLRILAAIIDYCPDLKLVPVSRAAPAAITYPLIELKPLDVPDVRSYIAHHPDASEDLSDPETVEKLHDGSDGLPMHLDRMLKSLQVSSLDTVVEAELDVLHSSEHSQEAPKALIHAVNVVSNSEDRRTRRSFRLLKVLSILPYGETADSLAHFLPTEPFFVENALLLRELALLDVITLQNTSPRISLGGQSITEQRTPKLLRVPRQVRDYVQSLISDDERDEIVLAGAEQFFGRKWREAKIRLRDLPTEHRDFVNYGPGNEFAIIHHLMQRARDSKDLGKLRRAVKLGAWYCGNLRSRDRYRDAAQVAHALLQQFDSTQLPEQWAEIAETYGEALRMTNKEAEALKYLQESLKVGGDSMIPSHRASVQISIALAQSDLDLHDEAIASAQAAKLLAKKDDHDYLQAEYIIADLTLEGAQRAKRLLELERKSRNKGCSGVANNIALDLAHDEQDPALEAKLLDRVLESDKEGYTNARAVLAKAQASLRSKASVPLTPQNVTALAKAYFYSHTQRLGHMFDKAHLALWEVLEEKGDLQAVLRLFRHSSFLWRIRGDEKKEGEYLSRLSNLKPPGENSTTAKGILLEVRYFWRRMKIIIIPKRT